MILRCNSTDRRRRGFTLVEVIVTTGLFSIVMSVLLVGVFSGTRAWDRADQHLERRTRVRVALEQFAQDVEAAQQPFAEGGGLEADARGRPAFHLKTLETRPGSPWAGALLQVEWSLLEEEAGLQWIRKAQPLIGEALTGTLRTETMIEEIQDLTIEVRQGGAWTPRLEDEGPSPELIRLRLSLRDGTHFESVAQLRRGVSSGGDDGADEDDEDNEEEEAQQDEGGGSDDAPGEGFP